MTTTASTIVRSGSPSISSRAPWPSALAPLVDARISVRFLPATESSFTSSRRTPVAAALDGAPSPSRVSRPAMTTIAWSECPGASGSRCAALCPRRRSSLRRTARRACPRRRRRSARRRDPPTALSASLPAGATPRAPARRGWTPPRLRVELESSRRRLNGRGHSLSENARTTRAAMAGMNASL